jgi:RNA polymerase sigma-70 factor (ECF subfamily)
MPAIAHALEPARAIAIPSFDEVYMAHVAFVWRILRTFGVAPANLEDAVQDVFVVVHRRLPEFEGRAAITTWLFAIARRVAGTYRRRAASGKTEELSAELVATTDTFADAARAEATATVVSILAGMDDDKRIVFALVELEQMTVPEVAKLLDVNLNTTYSRLRLARAAFETAVRGRVQP